MQRAPVGLLALIALLLATVPALGEGIAEKLGEEYTKAGPEDKLVMIMVAVADKVVERREAQAEVDRIYREQIQAAKAPQAKLERLGALRQHTRDRAAELTKKRREEKKGYVSMMDPNYGWQRAVAINYLAASAGSKPTLDDLQGLKLVHESLAFPANTSLITSCLLDALLRDESFAKGDLRAQLGIIKTYCVDKAYSSDQERTVAEKMVVSEWLSAQLVEGKKPAEVLEELKKLYDEELICFFTHSWAKGMVEEVENVR